MPLSPCQGSALAGMTPDTEAYHSHTYVARCLLRCWAGSESKHTFVMKRHLDSSPGVPCKTYKEAWQRLAELLRLPSVGKNPCVLSYLEENFPGLVLRDGDNEILLRRGFEEGEHNQRAARTRWMNQDCVGICKDEVLQRMEELRCWLVAHTHREQRYLGVSGSVSSGAVVVHEKAKVTTKAPEVVTTFSPGFLCAKPVAFPRDVKARPQPSCEDWKISSSPTLGSPATVEVKRVCLNVWHRLGRWLSANRTGLSPLKWNPEWLLHMRRGKSSQLRARAKRAGELMMRKWGTVVADLCGVSMASCYRWIREYKNRGLQAPSTPGPLALTQAAYQQRFRDLLAWAEAVCRYRRLRRLA